MRRSIWLLLLLLSACTVVPSAPTEPPRPSLATVTPGALPEHTLLTLAGEEVELSQWRGQPIVLNFWASWCLPCRLEMPELAAFYEGQEEIMVIGVNYQEEAAQAQGFVETLALPFPILLDEEGTLAAALGLRAMPTTYFIDAEGRVVGNHLGPLSAAALRARLEELALP